MLILLEHCSTVFHLNMLLIFRFPVYETLSQYAHFLCTHCGWHILCNEWTFSIDWLTQSPWKVRRLKCLKSQWNIKKITNKIVLFRNGRLNLALIYFHRYIRLTPLLAVCILLSVSLFRFTGSGPLWPRMNDVISAQCKQNWWATLLYIQNYSHPDDMVSKPKDAFIFNNNNKKQIMASIVLYLRVVPCCWYATLFFRTSRCLFNLSV